jgi:hypothetical protein
MQETGIFGQAARRVPAQDRPAPRLQERAAAGNAALAAMNALRVVACLHFPRFQDANPGLRVQDGRQ